MKLAHGTHKTSRISAEDFISRMPENVITHILDCLPIQDAVRTSILSRSWRFKWNMLSKLFFGEKLFVPGLQGKHNFNGRTISRFLPHLKGVVTKFYLHTRSYTVLDVEDVNLWVMLLSRKGIKEFTLINMHKTPIKLPTYLFFCLELKTLQLRNCCFHMEPTFCGFLNLMDLRLYRVRFESGNIGKFITRCPLLEILKISHTSPEGKLVEITKLENLKTLCLPLCNLESVAINSSNIFELVGSLPKLQELDLNFVNCMFVVEVEAGGRKLFPTTFPSLKALKLDQINFSSREMLLFALDMIWGCLNLQTLNITAAYDDAAPLPLSVLSEEGYSRVMMLQLQIVVFSSFRGSVDEIYLIKSILACSPLLKTIAIYPNSSLMFGGENGKLIFATKLLSFHRASTIAEVDMVIVPATTGQMGILTGHVPTIAKLKTGLLSVLEGNDVKKYFISIGFSFIHANSYADILVVEAVPLDRLDPAHVQKGLSEFTQKLGSASTDAEKAKAQIGVDVHSALNFALTG